MSHVRIRQFRLAAGFSLQEAATRLGQAGLQITRAGLSKHETGRGRPSARTLLYLARVYGVAPADLLSPPDIEIRWFAFRSHSSLGKRTAERVKAVAARRVEHQIRLARLLSQASPRFPRREEVLTLADAEGLAEGVRRSWGLGEAPLESVTQTIEDHGGVVVEVPAPKTGFDGLSGVANGRHPVIVVSADAPADRRRYTLAHELGHIAMSCDHVPPREQEPYAHRFAAAFIVPARVARRELGEKRRRLDLQELKCLKARYGLSIQAWIRRAADLEIITPASYRSLCRQISALGWRRTEPVVYDAEQRPTRLRQLVLRAQAEGMISRAEAEELLIEVARGSHQVPRGEGPRALLYASTEEREHALSRAAESAAGDYAAHAELREFDAFGERDLHDGHPDD